MNLKQIARDNIYEMRDAICWMALYKVGRSWEYAIMWPDVDDRHCSPVLTDPDERQEARNIVAVDPNAVFLNGYYCNLGPLEDMTIESLADGLRWQYEKSQSAMLIDVIM